MDRNSIIGLVLIGGILIGFSIFNQPSKEEIEVARRQQDSIALVEKQNQLIREKQATEIKEKQDAVVAVSTPSDTTANDSLREITNLKNRFGVFALASKGEEKFTTIENDLLKITLSNLGGKIKEVELKKYRTHDSLPLTLFNADSTRFGLTFFAQNRDINTNQLYFTAEGDSFKVSGNDKKSVSMRLYAGKDQYIEYVYTLQGASYMMDLDVNIVGMENVIASNASYLMLDWRAALNKVEKSIENERKASTVYYKYFEDEVDYLSERNDEQQTLQTKVKWVAFKQQFFTSVFIAKNSFDKPTVVETFTDKTNNDVVKSMYAGFTLPYGHKSNETFGMNLYFGPNHFQTLKAFDLELEKQIPLGWGIFGWVNRFAVIPVFNFLNGFDINFGIIILILTILIKVVLLPLTYKAYLSTAKMRVLKPEMDDLNEKYKNDDPMKKQQAVMSLYRKAGVNPLGGCLPMLLQMPILIAMFNFFPSSIELRQESFLWAKDLSTYDSILDLSFNIPFYGSHVSLFTILMTVSTIIYTRLNSQLTGSQSGPLAAQMKWMMYLMPIVFLGVFNNYSAGLSYYYFLANMLTFLQQYLIKQFVDEDKIHRQIQDNKKRPEGQQKSRFQKKLEELSKKQQALQQQKQALQQQKNRKK